MPVLLLAQVKIMPLGNSITQANTSYNSYRRALWHLLKNNGYSVDFVGSLQSNYGGSAPNPDFDLHHEGHWGWRADQLGVYIKQWATAAKPDIVLMHAGTNDILQKQSISSTISELSKLIDDLRAVNPGIKILFAQLIGADVNTGIANLNVEIAKLATQKHTSQSPILLVNQASGFYTSSDTYDGIHPNSSGEQKMANKWFAALKTVLPSSLRTAENPASTTAGLDYTYYQGNWTMLPDFNALTPVKSGYVSNFDLSVRNRNDEFAFSFNGYIQVPTDGLYTFYTSSDDGSKLYIGSTQVVNNDGVHALVEKSGSIGLKAGKHQIRVTFFDRYGGEGLQVRYQGPTIAKQVIPSTVLYRVAATATFSGTYKITVKHSGKALQVQNGSTADGANILQWTANGSTAQLWNVELLPDGYYKITSKASGKALDVQGYSTTNGANIHQWTYRGTDNQKWKIESVGSGYYKITSKVSEKVVDVAGVSTLDGANVHQWTYNGGGNQQWKLERLSTARLAAQEEEESNSNFYPNPASHMLMIRLPSAKAQEVKLTLFDMLSKIRLSKSVQLEAEDTLIELSTTGLEDGLYLLNIVLEDKTITKKIMVQK